MMNDDRNADPVLSSLTGMLSRGLQPIAPSAQARTRWLEALQGPERYALFGTELARCFDVALSDAHAALRMIHDSDVWQPGQMNGASWFTTPALRDHGVVLSRLPARTFLAKHTHSMRELTLVLDGLLIEDGMARRSPGDVIDMAVGTQHELAVSEHDECLVVFSRR